MKIYIIGTGPGEDSQITPKAIEALKKCDVIAGYKIYIDLIRHLVPDTPIIVSGMTKELERAEAALTCALEGKTVGVVSSGDAGIYGMASLMFEVLERSGKIDEVEIEVVAGVTAASSCAAVLGAPLSHDFAVISLSDLLTPWAVIEKRLEAAAAAGLVICLYNPSSKKRADYLLRACAIVSRHLAPDTACGYVRNIGRDGVSHKTMTLKKLADEQVDMFTTVVIGSASTKFIGGHLVTPRGYLQNG